MFHGAGEFRHRITIQRKTITKGSRGGPVEQWDDVVTVWAALQINSGREFFAARQTHSELSGIAWIRWRRSLTLTPDMRFKFSNRTFELIAPPVDVGLAHREWELKVKEVVS